EEKRRLEKLEWEEQQEFQERKRFVTTLRRNSSAPASSSRPMQGGRLGEVTSVRPPLFARRSKASGSARIKREERQIELRRGDPRRSTGRWRRGAGWRQNGGEDSETNGCVIT